MILADLGADVIKVELPGKGDESRAFGPFQNGESAYFASVNRGKKSVTIDLRTKAGAQLVTFSAGMRRAYRELQTGQYGAVWPRL